MELTPELRESSEKLGALIGDHGRRIRQLEERFARLSAPEPPLPAEPAPDVVEQMLNAFYICSKDDKGCMTAALAVANRARDKEVEARKDAAQKESD